MKKYLKTVADTSDTMKTKTHELQSIFNMAYKL